MLQSRALTDCATGMLSSALNAQLSAADDIGPMTSLERNRVRELREESVQLEGGALNNRIQMLWRDGVWWITCVECDDHQPFKARSGRKWLCNWSRHWIQPTRQGPTNHNKRVRERLLSLAFHAVRTAAVPASEVSTGAPAVTCSICLDDLHGASMLAEIITCGHAFHGKCIERWAVTEEGKRCDTGCMECRLIRELRGDRVGGCKFRDHASRCPLCNTVFLSTDIIQMDGDSDLALPSTPAPSAVAPIPTSITDPTVNVHTATASTPGHTPTLGHTSAPITSPPIMLLLSPGFEADDDGGDFRNEDLLQDSIGVGGWLTPFAAAAERRRPTTDCTAAHRCRCHHRHRPRRLAPFATAEVLHRRPTDDCTAAHHHYHYHHNHHQPHFRHRCQTLWAACDDVRPCDPELAGMSSSTL